MFSLEFAIFILDWDECYELDNPCGTGEICENQQGTYTCLCDKGYVKMAGGCIKQKLSKKKLSKNESTTIHKKKPTVNKNTGMYFGNSGKD